MKMYRIPHPIDYHKQGAFIVMAASADEAIEIVKARQQEFYDTYVANNGREPYDWERDNRLIDYSWIEEVKGPVTEDYGCDC